MAGRTNNGTEQTIVDPNFPGLFFFAQRRRAPFYVLIFSISANPVVAREQFTASLQ
jgi:hypothetical protein